MTNTQTYLWPGSVYLGPGVVKQLGKRVRHLGARHAFIITDAGVYAVGLTRPVQAALQAAGLASTVYARAAANPDVASIDAAAQAYRASDADVIVGLGGGSVLDTAKAVRLLLGGPEGASVGDFSGVVVDKPRPAPAPRRMPSMIAIPTTAGTGSEVTPWAVITHSQSRFKFGVGGDYLMPTIAVIDPELMVDMPPQLTAATGMDALAHLIEAYVSTNRQPLLDPLILRGIALIGQWLRIAVGQGRNMKARAGMAEAAMLGGMAISSNWLGACHSLAHQLSSFANVHHGTAIALMLPHQMRYSLRGAMQRYADVGQALAPQRRPANSLHKRASHAVRAVCRLSKDIGLPEYLRDVGVDEALIPAMAESAYQNDINHITNPWPCTQADLEALYRQALD